MSAYSDFLLSLEPEVLLPLSELKSATPVNVGIATISSGAHESTCVDSAAPLVTNDESTDYCMQYPSAGFGAGSIATVSEAFIARTFSFVYYNDGVTIDDIVKFHDPSDAGRVVAFSVSNLTPFTITMDFGPSAATVDIVPTVNSDDIYPILVAFDYNNVVGSLKTFCFNNTDSEYEELGDYTSGYDPIMTSVVLGKPGDGYLLDGADDNLTDGTDQLIQVHS